MRFRVPATLLFGLGKVAEIPALLREQGVERPLLVTDPGVVATGLPERLLGILDRAGLAATVWDEVAPNPAEEHVEGCRAKLIEGGYDAVVALGGGSVIDVGKVAAALAGVPGKTAEFFGSDRVRRPGLCLVAVPTTAGSGAEVSSHAVILRQGTTQKEVVAGIHLLPRAAVVDPELTLTLPPALTTWSAVDGFIHAIEAYLARAASPLTDTFARQAVPTLARALPTVLSDGTNGVAREDLALGCLYSGLAMANANAGAIHALGYPLTGRYGIPHGLANALVAVAVLARVEPSWPARAAELARLLEGAEEAEDGEAEPGPRSLTEQVRRFFRRAGITDRLSTWGVREEDLPDLAHAATHFGPVLANTPVAFAESDLLAMYRAAWG